ncbi:NAD(P)-dependent oxidoreductase [Nocardia sp. NPDC004260]
MQKRMHQEAASDTPDVLVVDDGFLPATWPFLRDRLHGGLVDRDFTVMWESLPPGRRLRDIPGVAEVPALVVLGIEPDTADIAALSRLAVVAGATGGAGLAVAQQLAERGIPYVDGERGRSHSQAEMAILLMMAGLRQLPTWHAKMAVEGPGAWPLPTWQYCDHPGYVNGTVRGKRVAVVGLDSVGMHIADLCLALGASVAAVDPDAHDIDFTVCDVRRIDLEQVAEAAEVVVVASGSTRLRLTADLVNRLAPGSLVVTVNRAGIDLDALRARVLRDELAWATDVHQNVPVPLGDPILARDNVVHTPGVAARTRDANLAVADVLVDNVTRVLFGAPPLPWDCIPLARGVEDFGDRLHGAGAKT